MKVPADDVWLMPLGEFFENGFAWPHRLVEWLLAEVIGSTGEVACKECGRVWEEWVEALVDPEGHVWPACCRSGCSCDPEDLLTRGEGEPWPEGVGECGDVDEA